MCHHAGWGRQSSNHQVESDSNALELLSFPFVLTSEMFDLIFGRKVTREVS